MLQALASEEMAGAALALSHYQSNTDADEVDLDLIELLLLYICEVHAASVVGVVVPVGWFVYLAVACLLPPQCC